MAKLKLSYNDREIEAEEVSFEIVKDGVIRIATEDGATLSFKPVIVRVFRTDEKNPDGERMYVVHSFSQVSLSEPPVEDRAAADEEEQE